MPNRFSFNSQRLQLTKIFLQYCFLLLVLKPQNLKYPITYAAVLNCIKNKLVRLYRTGTHHSR